MKTGIHAGCCLARVTLAVALIGCGSMDSASGNADGAALGTGDDVAVEPGGNEATVNSAGNDATVPRAVDEAAVGPAGDDATMQADVHAQPDALGPSDAQLGSDGAGLDSAAGCPSNEPSAGSPCPVVGAFCSYGGGICCGGGYRCAPDGTWQVVAAACACAAPTPDSGGSSSSEGGTCPASCTTYTDCNSCPQHPFGGWSCNNGVCQFMG